MVKSLPLFMVALAAPVSAQVSGMATIGAASERREVLIANGFPWHCTGTACTGPTSGDRFGDVRTCKDLARQVGAVRTFSSSYGPVSEEDLGKCNKRAKATE